MFITKSGLKKDLEMKTNFANGLIMCLLETYILKTLILSSINIYLKKIELHHIIGGFNNDMQESRRTLLFQKSIDHNIYSEMFELAHHYILPLIGRGK